MKTIYVPKREMWIESSQEFLYFDEKELTIEHSLVSLSEWESKYHKPFLSSEKTLEETVDYIKMMVIGEKPTTQFLMSLPKDVLEEINAYINDPMTATTISDPDKSKGSSGKKEIITAELIYYWMTAQNIPFECQYWHINKLITLIEVCAIKNTPDDGKKKRMTGSDLALRRAKMQAARAKYAKK